MKKSVIAATCLALWNPFSHAEKPETKPEKEAAEPSAKVAEEVDRPKIEICFVLDTTGSMSGLIQAAKDKIWSIANELVSTKPAPEIKFGLVAYRDRGKEEYITKVTDLSDDIDDIYAKLMAFSADGGGDGPESVNQALNEAVTKMSWSEDKKVLKIIFLVGDAPPHMDYEDDVKYADSCKEAMKRDLIINTIQCGVDENTTKVWNEISELSEGQYIAIAQEGGAVAMATPFDDEIAALNSRLSGTVVAYGLDEDRAETEEKLDRLAGTKKEALAERLEFLAKSSSSDFSVALAEGSSSVVGGGTDLVEKIARDELDFEDIEEDKLSSELKAMSPDDRKAYIEQRLEERKKAQKDLNELLEKRSHFIAEEKEKLREAGAAASFDLKVGETIREQAAEKGIHYEK